LVINERGFGGAPAVAMDQVLRKIKVRTKLGGGVWMCHGVSLRVRYIFIYIACSTLVLACTAQRRW
jgi:hypothetical protein